MGDCHGPVLAVQHAGAWHVEWTHSVQPARSSQPVKWDPLPIHESQTASDSVPVNFPRMYVYQWAVWAPHCSYIGPHVKSGLTKSSNQPSVAAEGPSWVKHTELMTNTGKRWWIRDTLLKVAKVRIYHNYERWAVCVVHVCKSICGCVWWSTGRTGTVQDGADGEAAKRQRRKKKKKKKKESKVPHCKKYIVKVLHS